MGAVEKGRWEREEKGIRERKRERERERYRLGEKVEWSGIRVRAIEEGNREREE